jgi:hypothetical protein
MKNRWLTFDRRRVHQEMIVSVRLLLLAGLVPVHAAIFDPGAALKADMAQTTPTNPYTDAQGGIWTYAKTTAVTNGTLTLLTKQTVDWGACFKGFSDSDSLPTLQVNTGTVAIAASNGLTDGSHPVAPNEIALHPDNGNQVSRFAMIRFVVPRTSVYHVLAMFRDMSSGGTTNSSGVSTVGVDVHLVVNGTEWTNAIVAIGTSAPTGSVASFTAKYCAKPLNAGDIVDFVVGPNGTDNSAYSNDGTAFSAKFFQGENVINLDLNGFQAWDTVPGTNAVYRGAAVAGSDSDYWNSLTISDTNCTNFTIPNLKLSDGLTNSTVRFSIASVDANPLGGDYNKATAWPNALMNDYTYLSTSTVTTATNRLVISGLTPGANYDLYFYSNMRGRFEINNWASDCDNVWFSTNGVKDYVVFNGIAADGSGAITGLFYRATVNQDAVFNGLQIVGSFPRQSADIVNLDIDGYQSSDGAPGTTNTFSGAARIGVSGDYWNSAVILENTVTNFSVSKLKLTDGATRSTVGFSLSATGGAKLNADRNSLQPYNALLDDYVYVYAQTNRFVFSGLTPNAAYDIYFYCRAGFVYMYGRFIINGIVNDCIDTCFPISATGGDCAVCSGIVADSAGSITGLFCSAKSGSAGVFNGFQLIGPVSHLPLGTLIRLQ